MQNIEINEQQRLPESKRTEHDRFEQSDANVALTIWHHWQRKGPRKSSMMESKASEECWFLSKSSCQEQRLASLLR